MVYNELWMMMSVDSQPERTFCCFLSTWGERHSCMEMLGC